MLKTLLAPVQAWLLSRGQCVGCGVPLAQGEIKNYDSKTDQITCKCKRVYLLDKASQKYRRARVSEIK